MRKKNCPLCVLSFDSCECGDGFVSLLRTYTFFFFGLWLCSENSPGIRDGVFFHALTQSLQANPGTYKIFPQSKVEGFATEWHQPTRWFYKV